MSEWADFVESYGYSAGDPDAFDKISSRWEHNEKEAQIKAKYEADIAKGKASPKKSYHNSKIKKFGFSNFKPYGNDIQSFSKKPITLVYGPNSIGKSSFIHINAYNNFIHRTKNFDLKNTNMFGDEINLGGFDKFIHKRDRKNSIKLEYEFEDCSEAIIDFLGLENSNKYDLEILAKFSTTDIEDIIKKSEYYTTEFISGIEQEDFFGQSWKRLEDEVIVLQKNRKNNNLSTIIYPSEANFIRNFDNTISEKSNKLVNSFYQIIPYIKSNQFDKDKFEKDNIVDIKLAENARKIDFENESEREVFISDILIPDFINEAKLNYLQQNSYLYNYIDEPKKLDDDAIKIMAETTISFISQLIDQEKFLKTLRKLPIQLKIISEIKYIKKFNGTEFITSDQLNVQNVSYYINNQLFDKLTIEDRLDGEGLKVYGQRNYIGMMESNSENFETIIPDIFKNLSSFIYEKIYLDDERKGYSIENHKDPVNIMHEQYSSILFLSYKNGYNDLIGAFNDMIGYNKMQYIGPLRFYPERSSSFKELDSDKTLMPDSKTSWSYLKNDAKLRDEINSWLKNSQKLKTPYEIKYRKLYDIENSFERLNLDDLVKVKSSIQDIVNDIEKYSITPEVSIEKQDELVEILSKEQANEYLNNWIDNVNENRKFVNKLIHFSSLSKKGKFQEILAESNLLNNIEYQEELVFEDLRNGTQISNRDLGLGISQILPVLIATNHQKNTTITIEQPELHLHPSVQCEIADEFIRSYHENKNEFIIETHSEHLLLRIMRRIRETTDGTLKDKKLQLTPDDVCLLYIDNENNVTEILELQLSKSGKLLDRWPNGFFEDGFKERFS